MWPLWVMHILAAGWYPEALFLTVPMHVLISKLGEKK